MADGWNREYEKQWTNLAGVAKGATWITPNPLPKPEKQESAFDIQVGGSHYKQFAIQPTEFIYKNNLGFLEGNAIKYLTRWKIKGGLEDLKKARHYVDMLIEMETPKE